MARIDIDDPYTSFLESQVKSGLYNTISEAARDAIRKQMEIHEHRRLSSIAVELAKGEASLREGHAFLYSSSLMAEISEKGKAAALERRPFRDEIRP
jgi:putative addiction module CopG family antidote